jgi:hypothetical protein
LCISIRVPSTLGPSFVFYPLAFLHLQPPPVRSVGPAAPESSLQSRQCQTSVCGKGVRAPFSSLDTSSQGLGFQKLSISYVLGTGRSSPSHTGHLSPQDGTAPLWIASQMGHSEVVRVMLLRGAERDAARNVSSLGLPQLPNGATQLTGLRCLVCNSPGLPPKLHLLCNRKTKSKSDTVETLLALSSPR